MLADEPIVDPSAVLGDHQNEALEGVRKRAEDVLLVGLLEAIHKVNEFALWRLYVFFGLGVHVHEEVKETEDLGMDVSHGDRA